MIYTVNDKYLNIEIDSLFVETVQDFFDQYIPSKKMQHLLIQNKLILMDGNPVKRESEIVGINLSICLYPETYEYEETDLKADVVYEDEILLIVNKPKGVLVHSDGNSDEITLTKIVESYLYERNYCSALPIHRLDKETTGLVIYSKSPVFQPLLDKLLSEKQIRRNYLAFVDGIMEKGKTISISKPIGKDRHNPNKRIVYKNGQSALTKVRCLGYSKKGYSILRCILDTGRTHQIRVHLASEGYPIINDDLYGRPSRLCVRMGLLADNVELYHPLKEEMLSIDADLPNDLAKLYFAVID